MLRAAIFACGIFVSLCGTAFLMTDKIVVFPKREAVALMKLEAPRRDPLGAILYGAVAPRREIVVPEWAAYATLSTGAVAAVLALGKGR
ncbi:hypothetical protein Mal52_51740 [Symmachiella dynata]|uniref:Uncharacterized protein n=2 Tax=Symmachiella dynata TaxID=2527995 RepID=A0A517ZVZ5_9PLAN|nr:hypothetical protein Mal52_51740 [Symmachiella dynata]